VTAPASGAGGTGLTLAEALSLVGVVIAILGVALAPLWEASRRTRKAADVAVRRCDEQVAVSAIALRSQVNGLIAICDTFEATIGTLHRLLEGREDEVPARAVVEQLHAIKIGVERAASEAALLSGADLEQRAALAQLVHRIGDRETAKLFVAIATRSQLGSLTGADLSRAVTQLNARLDGGR